MFGIRYVKFEPNYYVLVSKNGKIIREGKGLSFWFYAPSTSIVKIPLETKNVPFVFEEISNDFQTLTVQGDFVYKIDNVKKIAEQIDFTVDLSSLYWNSDDPEKLDNRIINIINTVAKNEMAKMPLRDSIKSIDVISGTVRDAVGHNSYLDELGIKVTNINILAILPNKDTARALEAETREKILGEADDAVYKRRNAAVEQERRIKENELNTEIAVAEKQRQIKETQIEADRSIKEKERVIQQEDLQFKIGQEQENTRLVELSVKNQRTQADTKAYALKAVIEPLSGMNPDIIKSLVDVNMDSGQLIASAFSHIAANADKIGELNISPDLLRTLLDKNQK